MLRGTSFIAETISVGGESHAGRKTQEDFDRERLADRVVGCAAAMKRVGLTANDYDTAKGHGFPSPIGRMATAMGAPDDGVPLWSARQIDGWHDEFKAFAKKVQ
jgi:hypothetical protein